MHKVVIAALLTAFTAAVAAQGVYKYTDKDGQVVYTDNPKAGGGTAQPVEDKTSTIAVPAPATSEASRTLVRQHDQRMAALDQATDDMVAAHNALRAAEARQAAGTDPVGDERQGRHLRPEYWARQRQLQSDIDRAQAQLNDALARRNALR